MALYEHLQEVAPGLGVQGAGARALQEHTVVERLASRGRRLMASRLATLD